MTRRTFMSNNGFTMIELLISLALGVFVSVMTVLILSPGLRHIREIREASRLHAAGVQIVETLDPLAKKAKEFVSTSTPSAMSMIMTDGTERYVSLSSGSLLINGIPCTDSGTDVSSLSFSLYARSFRISFTLTDPKTGKSLSAATTLARRNN